MKYISKYKRFIQSLVILLVLFVVIIFVLRPVTSPKQLLINGQVFNVEVADTPKLLVRGLSGHTPLSSREGMLFIFNTPGDYGIWMKDMTFPIDIIWINENNRVVTIEKAVSPQTYPKVFHSSVNSLYVLETASGEANRINLKNGDLVEFLKSSSRKLDF